MSLKKGSSKEVVGGNIKRLVHEWEDDGVIGYAHPKARKKAIKQAVAISLKKAGKSKYQKEKGAR